MAFGFPDGRIVPAATLDLAVVDRGSGRPVVLLHGFPELAYSWRHQVPALADAGFRVIAPDLRGFGNSAKPEAIDEYRLTSLVADYTALLDALGLESATIVGHDWGSIVAWAAALTVPARVEAVASLNVPYRGRCASFPRTEVIAERLSDRFGYVLFFQEPGKAEAWFAADPDAALLSFYRGAAKHPEFLSDESFAVYLAAFVEGGITGPVNLYRNVDANWVDFEHLHDAPVTQHAMMVAADSDPVLPSSLTAGMETWVPDLRTEVIADCGHWTQQEQPDAVNDVLISFLSRLP